MPARQNRPANPAGNLPARERAVPRPPGAAGRLALFAVLLALLVLARGAQAQRIGDLQGPSHRSPVADTRVDDIAGIVTAVDRDGFWMQDAGDGDPLSSDAIYVFRGLRLGKPRVGDAVVVSGQVREFRPGGAAGAHQLATTRIDASGAAGAFAGWRRVSSGNRLPEAIVIGPGFLPPTTIAPAVGHMEADPGHRLRPATYAIDFFEALEGMRVAIASVQSVGPRNRHGEIPIIAAAQAGMAGTVTAASGGLLVGPGRFNGHRIMLDDRLRPTPAVHTGARLDGVEGVLDYHHGHYKLQLTRAVTVVSNPLTRSVAPVAPTAPEQIALASYNVRNLGGDADGARIVAIATQIVHALGAPHLLALQEIRDDDGEANSGTVSADATLRRLSAELQALTGRPYRHVGVDPIDLADGGAPGANIRQVFLYDSARIGFAGPVGGPRDAVRVRAGPDGGVQLNLGAGRLDPTHRAFTNSRKPLVAMFTIDGQPLLVVNNHFNSKGADQPLFGAGQPPALASRSQRLAQARVVGRFVAGVLAIDPETRIVVTGDFNDFAFADTLAPLHAAGLVNLTDTLPETQRYTYNHDGNLQALDHMFVSPGLRAQGALEYGVVHVNADFSDAVSDHDPGLLRFVPSAPPGPGTRAQPRARPAAVERLR